MIGPSSTTSGVPKRELQDSQARSAKKRVFDELDIENFCEEICQTGRKRYLQELETPMELVATNQIIADTAALFSPLSARDPLEDECPVARLEVLLVDGTNCTWTTVSDLNHQQNLPPASSTSSSPSSTSSSLSSSSSTTSSSSNVEHRRGQVVQVDETNYQMGSGYWEPVTPMVTVPSTDFSQNKAVTSIASGSNCAQQQQQQQFDDQETGNLSWLLDFKLDPFIEAADDRSIGGPTTKDNHYGSKTKLNGRAYGSATFVNDSKRNYGSIHESNALHQDSSQAYSTSESRNFGSSRCTGPKKPPFTYTELIEHALQERGELTVSAIYQWISEHFPYYKSNDDRWKNSVRHNLSINPHFRKGSKAPHGAGHLWAIANRGDSRPRQIIAPPTSSGSRQLLKNTMDTDNSRRSGPTSSQTIAMDELEAATASITQHTEEENENLVNSVTLEHCAEQILSGIKKEVEVQYLVPMMVSNNEHDSNQVSQQTQAELHYPVKESDFLNPVSKEVVAEECGLISEGYLVTDLNPTTLGLNMVEPEIITPENLFGEELSFQFYELTSPSQLQSA